MTADQKPNWEVKRDELASMYEAHEESNYDDDYQGFIDGYNACRAEMQSEIKNLKSIIAKEMSENDEFGAEYVHVNILKSELAAARAEISELKRLLEDK